ncbi:ATP-dependent DNA helicase RecG [Gudongella sp. DL1XJH-153]|uniref:ATP-dependent DNA helicase RecG n=1 Tax=Gudongella sp. DL1XJH-153 TaxID=3409804 RepID=UPI003BB756C5
MPGLDTGVQYIKGVGPKKAYRLKRLGLEKVEDILYYLPKDYEDKRKISVLAEGSCENKNLYKVAIKLPPSLIKPRRGLSILKVQVEDKSTTAQLVWFNQDYLRDRLIPGKEYLVYGKLKKDSFGIQIHNPEYKPWEGKNTSQGITPVYGLTEGITNKEMTKIIKTAMDEYLQAVKNVLPREILLKYNFIDKKEAIKQIHYPNSPESMIESRNQLAFEELLVLQLGLLKLKKTNTDNNGVSMPKHEYIDGFIENLEFELTDAQKRVLGEIMANMGSNSQMNRLVQGDVGSGKTIIGIVAMYNAVLNGYQAAMMAPTEILALQHYESLLKAFNNINIKVAFLSGNQTKKDKEFVLSELVKGRIDIIVGTHALIQTEVAFKRLGLAITDEQHRFGVRQRLTLSDKGISPDVIVMTATPIPRTLALILYGDLDISIIDELPPGRQEIKTYAVDDSMEERIYKFVSKQIDEGRQAYIVCPLIEESEKLHVMSAEELYVRLKNSVFNNHNVALLHGRMNQKEKDSIMTDFKNKRIDILISTTVIEVGVNVPNASIMLIMNAERFGLAQLHQLRGRVGRGEYQSHCILVNNSSTKLSRERMRIMQSTNDGFKISEKDLELRGPGEFFGTRQHGIPELRIANLIRDIDILKSAQKEAISIADNQSWLSDDEYSSVRESINKLFSAKTDEIMLN